MLLPSIFPPSETVVRIAVHSMRAADRRQPPPGGAMRVAALGLHHETNTFSSFSTTYETFSTSSYGGLLRDSEIEQHQRASHSTFAGYFQAADEFGFDLVPLLFAVNDPSGTITRDA